MRNKRLIIIFSILFSITLIVLLGSIIFSVKTINTYRYNPDAGFEAYDSMLDARILNVVNIQKGKSVFLLNEKKIIEELEKSIPEVTIINIECKPPNRVTVNYVKNFNYFEIKIGDKYYLCESNGRVTDISETPSAQPRIKIISGLSKSYSKGDFMFNETDGALLKEITTGLERLNLKEADATSFIAFIDITKSENIIYIGTRDGIILKFWGRDDFFTKLRLGISAYVSPDFDMKGFNMISVTSEYAYADDNNTYVQ